MVAVKQGNKETIEYLIEKGAKIDEIVSEEDDEDNNFSVDGTELNFSMEEHFDEMIKIIESCN